MINNATTTYTTNFTTFFDYTHLNCHETRSVSKLNCILNQCIIKVVSVVDPYVALTSCERNCHIILDSEEKFNVTKTQKSKRRKKKVGYEDEEIPIRNQRAAQLLVGSITEIILIYNIECQSVILILIIL